MFFFSNNNNQNITSGSLEHAYLAVLNDDLDSAKLVFSNIDSPRAKWGLIFVEILSGYLQNSPTYFEIRNFLEIDLDFLLKNNKIQYVEQFLGAADLLSNINQETFKYIARVMYENSLFNAAQKYMDKSKALFYNDPELHFMYAKFYIHERQFTKANHHIDECLKILPDYFPAKKLKETISTFLN